MMKIRVKALEPAFFELDVDPSMTLYQVKQQIEDISGIPADVTQILLNEKDVDEKKTLQELGITEKSNMRLHVTVKDDYSS